MQQKVSSNKQFIAMAFFSWTIFDDYVSSSVRFEVILVCNT